MNAINGKLAIHKNIVNLVEDIRRLLYYFKDNKLEYCIRHINWNANALVQMAHLYFVCTSLSFLMLVFFFFLTKNNKN